MGTLCIKCRKVKVDGRYSEKHNKIKQGLIKKTTAIMPWLCEKCATLKGSKVFTYLPVINKWFGPH